MRFQHNLRYVLLLTTVAGSVVIAGERQPSGKIPAAEASATAEALDAYLAACVKHRHFSGSALVAKDGQILLSKGYGLADRENNVPCTPQTKFRLGSVTKQFTAMAIMILQERGKLDVRDKIGKYLPNSPATWEGITIHHLLCHSSGIPNNTEVIPRYAHLVAQSMTPDELVATFSGEPLLFQPGEKGRYSNSNYILLGMIIEKASGQHYDEFLRDNIFEPLEMTDTGFDRARPILKHRAKGYAIWGFDVVNTAPIDLSVPFAAGALYSTTSDLYRWSEALWTDSLVSAKTLEEIFAPRRQLERYPHVSFGYGWGVAKVFSQKRTLVTHQGGLNGFVSVINRYLQEHLTVIVLSNCEWSPVSVIGGDLGAIALDEKHETPAAAETVMVDAEILDLYTGKYKVSGKIFDIYVPSHYLDWPIGESDASLTLVISRDENRLFGAIDGQPPVELLPESQTVFLCRDTPQHVTFVRDNDGKATHLQIGAAGDGITAEKLNQPRS